MIDRIERQKEQWFPVGEPHTKLKLRHLKQSRRGLRIVAKAVIVFTFLVSVRLLALAAVRLWFPDNDAQWGGLFRLADCVLILCLVVLVIGLWNMHNKSRNNEDIVRCLMENWSPETKKGETTPSAAPEE